MNLESVSDKDVQELERLSKELLVVMRRAKLYDTILADLLGELEQQAADLRRARFDASDTPFNTG